MSSEMLLADKYLSIINRRGKGRKPLKRVYHNMRKEELFLRAYSKLYKNQGATTIGTNPKDTIQGMSRKRIRKIIRKLKDGTYRCQPARRVYIDKANGQKRPISIPNWTDKLVQEVMRMILEAYYEPRFRDSSHGFRPHRGCHTALRTIRTQWTGTTWFIEGDIKGCFDNIDHEILLTILKRDIQDERFIKLLKGMLTAGYLDDWTYSETYSGTPQGGIISPILANILLNEFDRWVEEELIPSYTKGKKRSHNPEYHRLKYKRKKAYEQGDRLAYKQYKAQEYKIPSINTHDPNHRRLRYVRYADDFILGFNGPHEEAVQVKRKIGDFLSTIQLDMSMEKTKITHGRTEKARFLGYDISANHSNTKRAGKRKNRTLNGQMRLSIPQEVVTKCIRQYSRHGKPMHRASLCLASDYEIIATIGAELRGIANYYMMATDVGSKIQKVYWYGKECARKTIAFKYRLRKRQSYAKYTYRDARPNGRSYLRVTVPREGKKPLVAKCGETPLKTNTFAHLSDTIPKYRIVGTNSELVRRLLTNQCELCGTSGYTEAHHVNKLANIKKKYAGRKMPPPWVMWMIRRNRKTIMVCKSCHQDITYGRYDGQKVG